MITPARQQYLRLKAEHPDAILLYRLGDFYEAFDEDAHAISQVLGITLTSRAFGRSGRIPMAGIPHHALNSYVRRLLRAGLRIAIGEQVSEPGRGLVEREIVRVLSPGTLDDPALLEASRANYLLALAVHGTLLGMAWVDVSTGACEYHAIPIDESGAVATLIALLAPAEVIAPAGDAIEISDPQTIRGIEFAPNLEREKQLLRRFPMLDLPRPAPLAALNLLVAYLERGHVNLLDAMETPIAYDVGRIMALDRQTRTNLEIDLRARGRPDLFGLLNFTRTATGARMLRSWLHRPLVERSAIERRLDAVQTLCADALLRQQLGKELDGIRDIERLATRARTGGIRARELEALRESLECAGRLRELLGRSSSDPLLDDAVSEIDSAPELRERIAQTIGDDDEAIRRGRDGRLDALYEAINLERAVILELERREKERTGIRALKVGYNRVAGYYFEVSRANRERIPEGAERRQTLTNSERYVTGELAGAEGRINALESKAALREAEVYSELLGEVAAQLPQLRATAAAIATIDALNALATAAVDRRYVRPVLRDDCALLIRGGRHPIVENELAHGMFVPNDVVLNDDDGRVVILTGPNMAGKSTWLRQAALIVLLAQVGSFVPAEHAEIGLVDRIFTRIGAHDDLARGQSTFMVEMLETASILQGATERSLVVLDEVGRGTSTEDGVAIATAVVEHLATEIRARTLFATHFRELAHAAARIEGARALQTAVARDDERLVFLHAIVPGVADAAFGLEIARLAGIPTSVLDRARDRVAEEDRSIAPDAVVPTAAGMVRERVVDRLNSVDIATTTPLDALVLVAELQARLRASIDEPLGPRALRVAETTREYGRAD